MASIAKVLMEVAIAMIFVQVVALIIASLANFSALGLMVAGFFDVILIALVLYYAVNKLS